MQGSLKNSKKDNQPRIFIIIIGKFKINIRDKNFRGYLKMGYYIAISRLF
jgi:hypothetical protein